MRGASAGLGQLSFDGVPLDSSVNGVFNLSTIPVDALERIEIVRGERTALREPGARGRDPLDGGDARDTASFVHLEGGSYGTLSETVGGTLRGTQARTTVTASRDDVLEDISVADARNGNSERDGFRTTQGVARLTLTPSAQWTLESSALYRQSRAEIDVPGLLPSGDIGLVDNRKALAGEETWVAQTAAHARLLPGWQSSLQLGFTRNRASLAAFNQQAGFDQRLLLAPWTNTHELYRATPEQGSDPGVPDSDSIWGTEVHQEQGEEHLRFRRDACSTTLVRSSPASSKLQGRSGPWAGFLGTSIDYYDDFGTHPTLYAGVRRFATPTVKLRASGGRGYRPPAFQELYFVPFFGNPSLVPEQSWSVDWPLLGALFRRPALYYRVLSALRRPHSAHARPPPVSSWARTCPMLGSGSSSSKDCTLGLCVTTGIDYTYTDSRDLEKADGSYRADRIIRAVSIASGSSAQCPS